MFGLSKSNAQAKQELNDDADQLQASGNVRGAERLRGIADTIQPAKQPKRR